MRSIDDMTHHDHTHDHASHDHRHDTHEHADGAHDHAQEMRSAPARTLAIALGLTASFMLVEVVAGIAANSLALISDAGHMLSDAGALGLALVAQRIAERPRTRERTFGSRRAETLAALANATALAVSSVFIVVEAVRRLGEPQEIEGAWMLGVATLGLVVNLTSAWVLSRGHTNANVRAAIAHVLADAAGSVAAMVAGGAIITMSWWWADAVSSIIISVLIAFASWRLLRNAARVLMESAPAGLEVRALEQTIRGTRGVADVHDLHAWRIEEGFDAASVHVVLEPGAHGVEVATEVARRVQHEHGLRHVTVQPEAPTHDLVPASALRRK